MCYNLDMENELNRKRKRFFNVLRPLAILICRLAWGLKVHKRLDIQGPYLVLANHTCFGDALGLCATFREPLHIVAASAVGGGGEQKGIKRMVGLLPIDKAGMDLKSVRTMLATAKAGESIGLYPEGNKTIDGSMLPVDVSIAKLAKKMGIKVVLFRTKSGYAKKPKWAYHARKGTISGEVSDVIEVEEIAALSVEELHERIVKGISYDIKQNDVPYHGRKMAEGIGRMLYYCPKCGQATTWKTHRNEFSCAGCGERYALNDLGGVDGYRFGYISDWNDWQKEMVKEVEKAPGVWYALEGEWSEYSTKQVLANGTLAVGSDGVKVGDFHYGFDEIDGVVLHDANRFLMTVGGNHFKFDPVGKDDCVLPMIYAIEDNIH
ncbi:MAG: 1-acyl-sn-glycerol-3-phosphate acyltransferase [Clostridia bacterium]|nr:1-acyl-sn-glycerol-3-phosphate acyltransferase [Clostridia bacterium]